MAFFMVPSFLGMLLCLQELSHPGLMASYAYLMVVLNYLNVIHASNTYFQYFDKKNRDYYMSTPMQRFKFVACPILLVIVSTVLGFFLPQAVILTFAAWTIPHFVKQNIGIYLLYQNPKLGEAVIDRNLVNWTQWLAFAFFFSSLINRLYLKFTPGSIGVLASGILMVAFFLCIAACIWKLIAQANKGLTISMPSVLFFISAIMFFSPYLVSSIDYGVGMMVPSIIHWLQYIGLSYILVKRKYVMKENPDLPTKNPIMFFVGFSALNVVVYFLLLTVLHGSFDHTKYFQVVNCFFLGVGMIHYLLDGFIWKFREKHNRESLLPYLVHQ